MKATATQYAKTLLELTDGKSEQEVSDVALRFAEVLKKDGQLKNFSKIVEKFSILWNEKNGIVEAEVVSSRKLSDEQIGQIKVFVKEKYSAKEVELENVVDDKIKGGFVLKVKDEILDASMESRLKKLKRHLIS